MPTRSHWPIVASVVVALAPTLQAQVTTRISLGPGGVQADNESNAPAISADGRFIAFNSPATNLVVGDLNNRWDAFVHDRSAGVTTRVSVGTGGRTARGLQCVARREPERARIALHCGAGVLRPGLVP
jgi:hypothetical protein